jgi:hypothetical protein
MGIDWAHAQNKDNLSNLIKDILVKKWIYKFLTPEWFKYHTNKIEATLEHLRNFTAQHQCSCGISKGE